MRIIIEIRKFWALSQAKTLPQHSEDKAVNLKQGGNKLQFILILNLNKIQDLT